MYLSNNIIRRYLKNCYFINGTAYAGKSTMCKLLAEAYGLLLCGENYQMDKMLSMINAKEQPNLSYFHTMKSWQEFLNRTPEEYDAWITGSAREAASFEIAELIRLSEHQKVIVDTNLPCDILREIADDHHVAILLSPQSMSVDRFFARDDEEKQFLLSQIRAAEDPQKTMENFRACLAKINSPEHYNEWLNSGLYTLVRGDIDTDTRAETLEKLARHFQLTGKPTPSV